MVGWEEHVKLSKRGRFRLQNEKTQQNKNNTTNEIRPTTRQTRTSKIPEYKESCKRIKNLIFIFLSEILDDRRQSSVFQVLGEKYVETGFL